VNRTSYGLTLLAVAAALAVAGCGSSDDNGGAYGGKGETGASTKKGVTPADTGGAFVSLASVPKLGLVLVDSHGYTLYDFHKDKGTKSSCYGACAKVWPPLTTSATPQPSNGASAAKRSDGTLQVTYAGHPLYTYVADKKPGEANGNDFSSFGAQWYALKSSGQEAEG